jgi:riboflavin synthase
MFTGIIEHLGTIAHIEAATAGGKLTVHAPTLAPHLAVSGSVAVNGCCLTIVHLEKGTFSADLSGETLAKTSFSSLRAGVAVNLEQPLSAGKEFGGHFVLGHVDGTGRVTHLSAEGDCWLYGVEVPPDFARYIVPKGSITIDGISLTIARWENHIAEIAVVPYTYAHTNIGNRVRGDFVNLEADILGKYVQNYLDVARAKDTAESRLTLKQLVSEGF